MRKCIRKMKARRGEAYRALKKFKPDKLGEVQTIDEDLQALYEGKALACKPLTLEELKTFMETQKGAR